MESFYEKLGEKRLDILLENFYDKIFESELLRPLFMETPKEEIKSKQKLFLTQFLGGPPLFNNKFGNPKMKQRHMPFKITIQAKDEWLRCMKESIQELDWDENFKEKLYSVFPRVAEHMVNS